MHLLKVSALSLIVMLTVGCSSRTGTIDSCSYEVEKLLLPWFRPDGTLSDVSGYNLRQADLLHNCIASKGWVFNNARANAEYQAGRSQGLVGQYKEPANWSWGWFGLIPEAKNDFMPLKP